MAKLEVEARVRIKVYGETEDDAWRILNEIEMGDPEISVDMTDREGDAEIEITEIIG